jgi:hypothetical protein
MRQDAIKRIRDMHTHSQAAFEKNLSEGASHNAPENKTSAEKQNTGSTGNSRAQNNSQNSRGNQNTFPNQQNRQNSAAQAQQSRSPSMGNPFAQLFGSNMGGFNRYKQQNNQKSPPPSHNSPPPKKDEDLVSDIKEKLSLMLKDFKIDDEKIILGLLIYVLYKNKADFKLLVALAYLII